ncbi:unnamed protein product, partial [Acanthocheilonema viteae]
AICALVNDEWIRIDGNSKESENAAELDDNSSVRSDNYYNYFSPFVQADRCKGVGVRHFWRTAKFGSFVDVKGVYHTTYHFDGKVVLAVLACIITLIVGAVIYSVYPFSGVTVGAGSVLIAVSGISSFFAAAVSILRKYRVARQRRFENQRLLCTRSLRSWREVGHRPEDMQPITDFERYLDSWATSVDTS